MGRRLTDTTRDDGTRELLGVHGHTRGQRMRPTRQIPYAERDGAELALHVFEPGNDAAPASAAVRRPAIDFFFGGGWTGGTPAQFYPHCASLASRGLVAISAEYCVRSRHGTTPFDAVEDARAAIAWVRAHVDELAVDGRRIAAGGGSAGGHLAACAGVIPDPNGERDSKPDALVLFNPVTVFAPVYGLDAEDRARQDGIATRLDGKDGAPISPYHHVAADAPPTILFHGEADSIVPFRTAELFAEAMASEGVRCELHAYADEDHGFFNYGRGDTFLDTVRAADEFLTSLAYADGPPEVDAFGWDEA